MKLNHEGVRDLMLAIESVEKPGAFLLSCLQANQEPLKAYTLDELGYAAARLIEAKYLNGKPAYDNSLDHTIKNMTWEGHQFLDNIRDNGVWKDTKAVIAKFSSVSLGLMSDVASKVITELVKTQLRL